MKAALIVLAVLALIYCVILVILVRKFTDMILTPKVHHYDDMVEQCIRQGVFTQKDLDELKPVYFSVDSRYGYALKGMIIGNEISARPENRKKVAVLCHGYTAMKISMLGYAKKLMNLGFTCVMYDHRNHGDTGPVANTSMSYFEKYDLQTILDYCYKRFGSDIRILTYGESMGSATVLSHLEIDSRPVMTIADCGYSDLSELCRYLLVARFHVPKIFPVLPLASRAISRKGGFPVKDVSPKRGVEKALSPILFCHGLSDTFVPCYMSEQMSKLGSGVRRLHLFEGAPHAQSEVVQPEEYTQVITDFINEFY